MQHGRSLRRSALLAFTLLSACAASDPASSAGGDPAPRVGAAGAFLAGRFAATNDNLDLAAREFLKALSIDDSSADLKQQAFLATLMVGRPEAVRLAEEQPNNQAAQLLLGDTEARAGNWEAAERRFQDLSKQGLTQVLQPVLVAWAQQGAGQTDAALATLRPYVEGQRLRGIYALHAALIADLANRPADAARLYRIAQTDSGGLNLEMARLLASWEYRQGHENEARQTILALLDASPEAAIVGRALEKDVGQRQVRRATDGIAEAYLALAGALRQQDANEFAAVLLRLALDLRPDFTAARLLGAEVVDNGKHPDAALAMLEPVPGDDPLAGLVRLRRAALLERLGNTEEALKTLDQVAHDFPERPEPFAMKGDFLREKRRFAEAVAAYDQAVARVPHPTRANWPLFYDRAIALERSHQWERAEADFNRALELQPDQPYVLNYLGYSWTEQNRNLPRAREMIERAVQARPNDGSIIDSLGWVMLRQGDIAGAVKSLERAVELDPEDATVNGHLGDAYWAAGRKREAQFQWRRALNLNPEPDEASRLESRLKENGEPQMQVVNPATAEKTVQ